MRNQVTEAVMLATVASVGLCSSPTHANDLDESPQRSKIIEKISKINTFDIKKVGEILGIRDLSKLITWSKPGPSYEPPTISAHYDFDHPYFGISSISFVKLYLPMQRAPVDEFRMIFSPGFCPTREYLETVLHVKAAVFDAQSSDGGPNYPVTSFTVTRDDDAKNYIALLECGLYIAPQP